MEIPKEIENIINSLEKEGFEAYLVGGCVRDFLLKKTPKDWDITTNAKPEEILKVFPNSFTNNKFGTVTITTKSKNENLKEVEITPYRIDGIYSDNRHPDSVLWTKNLEEDLKRRDFTINAIALKIEKIKEDNKKGALNFSIIDFFEGEKDLKKGIIKAVGDPNERFKEDALRMLRAVRFFSSFNFKIEKETEEAIKKNANLLINVSSERIRDEFIKIIMSENAHNGIEKLRELNLLKIFLPELNSNYGVGQNKHHIYDCYNHALFSLKYTVEKNFNFYVRISALFHDIGKPKTKRGDGENSTFYNHEVVGANMTKKILERLKFPKKDVEKIVKLIRYHLFYYNVGEVGESSVRRLIKNVGRENIEELLQLRMADRIGSGVPKAEPYKLRHLKYIIEKVSKDPISVSMLKIGGKEIIETLDIKPGPKVGMILDILLELVLNDPKYNKKDILLEEVKKLGNLSEKDLLSLSKKAKEEKKKTEEILEEEVKKKYWVK